MATFGGLWGASDSLWGPLGGLWGPNMTFVCVVPHITVVHYPDYLEEREERDLKTLPLFLSFQTFDSNCNARGLQPASSGVGASLGRASDIRRCCR